MKKLKTILLCSVLLSIYVFLNVNKEYEYKEFTSFEGTVIDITYYDNKVSFILKNKEKILVNDYNFISDIKLGDYVKVKGTSKIPSSNTNFYLFNYKNYLLSKGIHYTFTLDSIDIIKESNYSFKNKVINHLNRINNPYVTTMILAKNSIDDEVYKSFQDNGISHLFCVSGMHISFFILILSFILNKILKRKHISNLLIVVFLILYIVFTNYSASIIRCSLFFIIKSFLDLFKIKTDPIYIILFIISILLIINPYYIYNVGFIYSFTVSIGLIIFKDRLNSKNYLISIFKVSLFCFLISLPITVNQIFSINLLSPILNIIFIPFMTFIIFPLSLLTFVIPVINPLLEIVISVLERLSIFFSNYKLEVIIPHLNIIFLFIYYGLFYLLYKSLSLIRVIIFTLYIVFLSDMRYLNPYYEVTFLDIGQGDSILISYPYLKGDYLIDTGGNYNYSLSENIIIPSLKARGIKKLKAIILSHGDFDHMGETINLIENYKVEKVIFNCGEQNDLEEEVIDVLNKKDTPYYSCIKELNIDKNKLYFLQTNEYDNENDSSNVIYTKLNVYKFLFMGDAGREKERDILDKYNINNIDILKVGHHGSKTSSGKDFIDEINPKYSIISVGKNNRYGHPNKEVLDNLKYSNIYRTDVDGSIMFKIKNNKLKIETCSP